MTDTTRETAPVLADISQLVEIFVPRELENQRLEARRNWRGESTLRASRARHFLRIGNIGGVILSTTSAAV